jgi:parallel beta-helix repeat protein
MATARARTGVPALPGGVLLALPLMLASAGPAAAGVAKIVSCPALITAPGTYVLANDLNNCFPTGIVVQASDVHLVLGGHTISGSPGASFGIEVGSPFSAPVTGVKVGGGGTVTGFGVIGITVTNASGVRISGTTVSGVGVTGISLNSCTGCRVVGNRVSDNSIGSIGILVEGSALNTRISGNTVTGNTIGIEVPQGTAGVLLTGNVATGNGGTDLLDDNPGPPCANTWRGNTFGTAGGAAAACIR